MNRTWTYFTRLVAVERRKLFGRALLWAELGILALFMGVIYVALIAALNKGGTPGTPPEAIEAFRRSLYWPAGLYSAFTFANGGELGGMFVAVLVGAFVAQEYTWHTLHFWLSRGVARTAYLLAKSAVIVLALLLLVLTALVVGGGVTGVFTYLEMGGLPLKEISLLTFVLNFLRTALTLLPYAALTLFLAVVSRSTMVAIGVSMAYSLLVENLIVELLALFSPDIARGARFLPTMLSKSLMQLVSPAAETQVQVGMQTQAGSALLSPNVAALLLVVYTLVLLGLSLWFFRRQDITV